MVDWYTKAILTVIAAALIGLALQMHFRPADAQMGGLKTCGMTWLEACYVQTNSPINVRVTP